MATAEERKARMKNKEKLLHWSDEKEVIKSSRPLKVLLTLMLHIPICLVLILVYPVSFFLSHFFSPGTDGSLSVSEAAEEIYARRISENNQSVPADSFFFVVRT